jgi:hypothetical protein
LPDHPCAQATQKLASELNRNYFILVTIFLFAELPKSCYLRTFTNSSLVEIASEISMKIEGIQGMTVDQLNMELQRGGKFVIFQYAVSVVIMSFKRPSAIYFIRAGESTVGKSIGFTLITLVFGWWGIPFGPIYSCQALATNFRGGKNLTTEVVAAIGKPAPASAPIQAKAN